MGGGVVAKQGEQGTETTRFIRRVLIVLALVSVFFLAWTLRSVLLMLFGAVIVATIFRSLADRLQPLFGGRIGVATGASIILILGGFVAMVALFGAQVAAQIDTLRDTLPQAWKSLEARIGDLGLGHQLSRVVDSANQGSSFASFSRTVMSIGSGIAETLVVIVAGIFLASQPRFYATGAIKLVPPPKRALVAEAMDECEEALRLWLKGQLIAMVVVGALVGFGLWMLGVPSALTLGLLAGLLEFIPFAGPILAMIPAVLLALAVSPDLAIWVLLLYLAVQQFEGNVLTPVVQQFAVDLPGVVLLFSLIAFGLIFGTLGVILAAPLAVVTYVLVKRLCVEEALHTETPIPGDKRKN
jgi:predicted PurR-regulated permease PerM